MYARIVGLLLALNLLSPTPAQAVSYAVCYGGCQSTFAGCLNMWDNQPSEMALCDSGLSDCAYGCAIGVFIGYYSSSMAAADDTDLTQTQSDHVVRELTLATTHWAAGLEGAHAAYDEARAATIDALDAAKLENLPRDQIAEIAALRAAGDRLEEALDGLVRRPCFRLDAFGVTPPPPALRGRFVLSQVLGRVRAGIAPEGEVGRLLSEARAAYDRGDRRFAKGVRRSNNQASRAVSRVRGVAGWAAVEANLATERAAVKSGRSIRACLVEALR